MRVECRPNAKPCEISKRILGNLHQFFFPEDSPPWYFPNFSSKIRRGDPSVETLAMFIGFSCRKVLVSRNLLGHFLSWYLWNPNQGLPIAPARLVKGTMHQFPCTTIFVIRHFGAQLSINMFLIPSSNNNSSSEAARKEPQHVKQTFRVDTNELWSWKIIFMPISLWATPWLAWVWSLKEHDLKKCHIVW